jgi:hypothetical protein
MNFRPIGYLCPCLLLSFGLVWAADQNTTPNRTNQDNNSSTEVHTKIDRSRMAARLLDETNRARTAIANNNKQSAMTAVDKALNYAKQLQNNASGSANANWIPLYTEWDEAAVIAPVEAQQKKSGHLQKPMNNQGQNGQSADRQASTTEERAAVRDVEAGFTAVGLDTKMAADHLSAAKTALQNSNMQAADNSLAAVQDGVSMVSVDSDMPLVKVRENLALASDEAQRGRYKEASAALTAAANGLNEYGRTGAAKNAQAKQLSSQISSYVSTMANDHANADSKIRDWWNEVSSWTPTANTAGGNSGSKH